MGCPMHVYRVKETQEPKFASEPATSLHATIEAKSNSRVLLGMNGTQIRVIHFAIILERFGFASEILSVILNC